MFGGSRKAHPLSLDAFVRSYPQDAAQPERTESISAQMPEYQMPDLVQELLRICACSYGQNHPEEHGKALFPRGLRPSNRRASEPVNQEAYPLHVFPFFHRRHPASIIAWFPLSGNALPVELKKLSVALRSLLLRERDQLAFALDFAGIGVAFRHILKPGEIRVRFRGILVRQQRAGVPGA